MSRTIKTIYRNGQIELPPDIRLPEGAQITVILPDGSLQGKAAFEIRTLKLETPPLGLQRYSTAEDWLEAIKIFEGDREALKQHFEEIEAERQRQRPLEKHT